MADPRLYQIGTLASLLVYGMGWLGFDITPGRVALLLTTVLAAQWIAERARTNKLQPADITGATFTISNLGMYHVDSFTAIIVPPRAGILAVGAMTDRLVPVPGGIGVRPIMTITLSCDHRVVDGARGAAFMHDLSKRSRIPRCSVRLSPDVVRPPEGGRSTSPPSRATSM